MWFNRMVFTRGLETHQNAILLMLFFISFFFIYGMLHLSSHYCGFILDPAQRHSVTGIEISQELFPEMFLFTSLIFWVCGRNSHSIFHFLVQLRKMPVRHLNLMVSCVTVTFFPRYLNFLAALPAAELILTWRDTNYTNRHISWLWILNWFLRPQIEMVLKPFETTGKFRSKQKKSSFQWRPRDLLSKFHGRNNRMWKLSC